MIGFLTSSTGITWIAVVLAILFLILLSGIRFIPNNRIGIVEKRWSFVKGSVKSGLLALHGEAGYQPQILRGGLHYLMPIQYVVHMAPLVTISQGKIGYVFARDGKPLEPAQVLASNVTASDFQDVVAFMTSGGQRGPQRRILREGTYAFNLVEFIVITEERVYALSLSKEESDTVRSMASVIAERSGFRPVVIKDTDDMVGIVTVHDGPSLVQGEIIAHIVGDDSKQAETYLLYQPPLRHGRDDPEDDHRGRQRGRGGFLHRRDGRRPFGQGLSSRGAGLQGQPRRVE